MKKITKRTNVIKIW